ncbi:discoidin domain-containing protein [Sphaerisporangium sp. TRM90804]|uniref:galactose-binding domain-containing protein n=1 Tax=Sphaerisporangium sp. TRM90804 TaxID=3031113 RepID=UPI00244CAD9B|nr:discoidin domain-containing protein [Sphaerisporangium sp. TRM90804]MDH2426325.1 discoidin domain-containing protein [Sphaerisporangium sp. TRM90804]
MPNWRSVTAAAVLLVTTGLMSAPAQSAAASGEPAAAARATAAAERTATDVHLFYYPWYGSPQVYGSYRHWQQGGHTPPESIGADLYPKLGAYDSGDLPGAVTQHMRWIQQSGAGVIVYSWWGQGSYEDGLAAGVLATAARFGVKVAWHLEPYSGRTAASTVADINYINSRYGGSPAFYRDAAHGNRGAFYVFESLRITDWAALDQVSSSSIVLAQTTDTSKVAHFGGMYTYDAIAGLTAPGWKNAGDFCKANGLVWAPSVGPGYIDDRAVVGNTTPTLPRDNGATYDTEWRNALDPATGGPPSWVSVTSFNEWHEGSVLEPVTSTPPAGYGYQTFEGAYGKTGAAAETAYLDRTRYWVEQFTGTTVPQPNPNLAARKPISATSHTQGYVAANANDGNTGSYWESANHAFPQSITVDLGAASQVGRIVLTLPPSWGARTQTLSVHGSQNGSAYTTLAQSRGYTFSPSGGNAATITFPATTQRHIRLTFTGNTGWPAGQVSEFQVYRT